MDPGRNWTLPPLILHPFSEPYGPERLAASSRASLMLQGVLPCGGISSEDLERQLLDGRYCELTMLFYVGKDLLRWAGQCMELVERTEVLRQGGIRAESFVQLLVDSPPDSVARKLRQWGVYEFRTIFSRAVGLHAVFDAMPLAETLHQDFIRYYHRFADAMFACRQQLFPFTKLHAPSFAFELYSSSEYAKMLEKEWGVEESI